ncbi:MAG: YjfB family protein [Gammaproteobacteria bacterium]|nr:YjfB family protein [Gammaproteobacteria bacterium]
MDISSIPSSLLQQIGNGATQNGDAVTVSVLRKAMDIQAAQATQLIDSVAQSMPDPGARLGQQIDVKA